MSGGRRTIEADEPSDVESVLGIDLDELEWQDLALCDGMETNLFFDEYESSEQVAQIVDEACLSCPVMVQCLMSGVDNSEWGVWGGVYLTSGKADANRNSHKSKETWKKIKERIGDEPVF